MKFNCIKCGKLITKLDMRKAENKDDEELLLCKDCLKKDIEFARGLFK